MRRRIFNSLALFLAFASLVGLLIGLGALKHARAAPPAGMVAADPAVGAFYRNMMDRKGNGCCSSADCRNTMVDVDIDGRLWAWIGREQFGAGAPDQWMPVPVEEIQSRDRPPGVHGAIVCYFGMRVACVDLEAGG